MRKPCCNKQDNNKGAWSKQEDQRLIDYIQKHGEGCWRKLAKTSGLLRCGKSCRLRWINYLRPDIKRGNFGEDEQDLIIKLHALLGNRWSLIAGRLPGRTDNEVKNYWNTCLRRKLIKMGIDPNNHRMNQWLSHTKNIRMNQWLPRTVKISETNSITSEGNTGHLATTSTCKTDHVSDSMSCLENEQLSGCRIIPDLNLDISLLNDPSNVVVNEEDKKTTKVVTTLMPEKHEFSPTPTLQLFG